MKLNLKPYFVAPVFEGDEEKTRAAVVLNALQLILLTVTFLATLASLFVFVEKVSSLLVVAGLAAVVVTSRVLMYKGRVRLGSILVIGGIWLVVTLLVAFAGGMQSIDAVYYLSLTIIGGLLLGSRATISIAMASALVGLAMVLSETLGYPLPQLFPVPAIAGWINFVFSLFLVSITLNIALRSLREALALSRQRLRDQERAEAALRQSEARLRAIFEAATDVSFIVTDADDVKPLVLEFSPGAERIFGYSREEIIGKPVEVLHIPEDIAQFPEATRKMREGETSFQGETKLVRKSGETFPALFTTYPLFDADGGMRAALGISIDITERKQAEQELEYTKTVLEAAFEQIPIPIALASAPDMIVRIVNPTCREFLGITDEPDYVGQFLPDLAQTWQDFDPEGNPVPVTELPLARALQGVVTRNEEYFIQRKDGEIRWELVSAAPIYNKSGRMIAALVTFPDITERKLAEQEQARLLARIREQARQVQQIIDTVPEGVLLLDERGRVTLANPLGREVLQSLAGASVGDVVQQLGDHDLQSLLRSPPSGLWHELSFEQSDYQMIARPIDLGTGEQGWLVVIRDVTQQREIERQIQQQERLAAVGQLAAGIAHDFNNIMATVMLYTQMSMRAADIPVCVRERLEIIHQQSIHATNLIQQILDFSGRAIFERHPLDLAELLQTQIALLRRTLPENIKVFGHDGPGDFVINGSSTAIQQVIMNLAVNARDAMPTGGELRFALKQLFVPEDECGPMPKMEAGSWIHMTVMDTGAGIASEVIEHIFDPFFTTKGPGEGTGLGLAQVHGIVSMHGGHIDVDSQSNVGTTFHIYLPAMAYIAHEACLEQAMALVYGQGQTILLVEDNPITRTALVESLETFNYQVQTAANGRDALAMMERQRDNIALVLSDVVMPDMGGIDMLHEMARRDLTIPVVLLTGHPLQTELEQLQAQEGSLLVDWLLKPPDLEALSRIIARGLQEQCV